MSALASFGSLYDEHVDFVWRTVRRLGVPAGNDEDAVQDVFLTVHRKLGDFEGRSSMKTWLFGIAQSVVRNHRRTARRKRTDAASVSGIAPDELPGELLSDPFAHAAEQEALVWVQGFLDRLDEDKRAVFVLAELEEMPAPEIAEAVGANVNTVYSRLRAARAELGSALSREAVKARHEVTDDAPPEDSRARMRALLFAKLAAGPGAGLTVASLASAPAVKTIALASAALLLAVVGAAGVFRAAGRRAASIATIAASSAPSAAPSAPTEPSAPAGPAVPAEPVVEAAAVANEVAPEVRPKVKVAPPDDAIAAEIADLRRAEIALGRGAPEEALAALAVWTRPDDPLHDERWATQVVAFCQSGDTARGRHEQAAFLRARPSSPLAPRVLSACVTKGP